jgi:hypothetical protein
MTTITIPKKNSKAKELVAIPREEYEELLDIKKNVEMVKEFIPTAAQKKDLTEARKEYEKGEYITLEQLDHELGITSKRKD